MNDTSLVCMLKHPVVMEFWKACSWFEWIELTIAGTHKNLSSFSVLLSSSLAISLHAKFPDEFIAPRSRSGN